MILIALTTAELVEVLSLCTRTPTLRGSLHDALLLFRANLPRLSQWLEHSLIIGRWRRRLPLLLLVVPRQINRLLVRFIDDAPLLGLANELADFSLLTGSNGRATVRYDGLLMDHALR